MATTPPALRLCTSTVREYSSTGHRLRFPTKNIREQTVFHEYLQEACFVLTNISGNLLEFTGECNLGILYPSSLLTNTVHYEYKAPANKTSMLREAIISF